jgi:response regulator RpfG family c-di-GMP phosphodiesterase
MERNADLTVLYLDDEEINLFIFEANFKHKFEVITAANPEEALKVLEEDRQKISAVISDMRMPGMNGVEFIRSARKQNDKIPYYILSGFNYNEEINQAINEKIVKRFFEKPFNVTEIERELIETAAR